MIEDIALCPALMYLYTEHLEDKKASPPRRSILHVHNFMKKALPFFFGEILADERGFLYI